jgi:2-polyprenyl-3-methyl-5-hydroxy-6-metoxy-1,4-benzoquinol methylase
MSSPTRSTPTPSALPSGEEVAVEAFAGVPRRRGKPLDAKHLQRSFDWRRELAARHRALAERIGPGSTTLQRCPICEGGRLHPFLESNGFPFVTCRDCNHLFSARPPDEETVRRIYAEDVDARRSQAISYVDDDLFQRRVEQIARPKVEYVRQTVPPGGRWVDVGCATGEILFAAQQAGWQAIGIEADPTEVAFGRRRGLTIVEDFLTARNTQGHLQGAVVVSLLNTLEHVNRPVDLLAAAVAPLDRGAHVVLEVPRHPSLSSLSNQLFPRVTCRHVYGPEHLHVFSERAMEILLERAGLRPVCVWTFGQDFQELLATAGVVANLTDLGLFQKVNDLAPAMQQVVDDGGLSDALFVVAVVG